jgi:hypothetical protein
MWPVIGDIRGESAFGSAAAALRQAQGKTERNCSRDETFNRHRRGRIVEPARSLRRAPLTISFDCVAGR